MIVLLSWVRSLSVVEGTARPKTSSPAAIVLMSELMASKLLFAMHCWVLVLESGMNSVVSETKSGCAGHAHNSNIQLPIQECWRRRS